MSPLVIVVSEIVGTDTAAVFVIEPPVAFTVRDESVCVPSAMPPALFIVSVRPEAELVKEVTLVASVGEPEANVNDNALPNILAPLDSETVPTELRVTEVLPLRSWLSAMSPLLIVVNKTTGTDTAAVLVIEPPVAFTVRDESDCAPSASPPALFIVSA